MKSKFFSREKFIFCTFELLREFVKVLPAGVRVSILRPHKCLHDLGPAGHNHHGHLTHPKGVDVAELAVPGDETFFFTFF